MPDIEVLDVRTGQWVQFAHMAGGQAYELENAARWVNPASGAGPGEVREREAGRDRLPVPARRSRGPSSERDRPHRGTRQALRPHARRRGPRPRRRARARSSASSGPTAPARPRRCGSWRRCSCPTPGTPRSPGSRVRRNPNDVRRVLGFMPDAFGVYDDMKVWEYLDFFARCYGIPADRAAADDRRPARPRRPRRQARHVRPGPLARHAAAAVPRARARPRPARAAPRRAGVRPRPARPRRAARAAARAADAGQDDPRPSATSSRSSRSCARRSRSSTGARCSPRAGSPTSSSRLRVGAVYRVRILGDDEANVAARAWFASQHDVVSAQVLEDGTIEIGFHGDDEGAAALLGAAVRRGPADRDVRPGRERPRGAVPPGHRPGTGRRRSGRRERRRHAARSAASAPCGTSAPGSPRSASRSSAAGCAAVARSSC